MKHKLINFGTAQKTINKQTKNNLQPGRKYLQTL